MSNYYLAGFLNNAGATPRPVVQLCVTDHTEKNLREGLADMHSKGTTFSCAVATARLEDLCDEESRMTLAALLELEAALGTGRFSDLIQSLLEAGARMALLTPDISEILTSPNQS